MGWYMNKLLEFVQIFDQLFTNFSAFERESAITKISEVNQMSLHEENADEFFISEAGFLHLDFRDLEGYLGEKSAIIMNFIRLALGRRQVELGIYNDILGVDRVQQLRVDLAAIRWI